MFLPKFDILCDSRDDICTHPWATPKACYLMNKYFKICRAGEETTHLNIKIQRVIIHLYDKEQFLLYQQQELTAEKPALAHQVHLYRLEQLHFARIHMLGRQPGFTGLLSPGAPLSSELSVPLTFVFKSTLHDFHQGSPFQALGGDEHSSKDVSSDGNVQGEDEKIRKR